MELTEKSEIVGPYLIGSVCLEKDIDLRYALGWR